MIGNRLGSYEIIEEVGKGGMATVYRAYQPNVDRFVALKVIQKSITGDTNAMERFQREARLVARLEHPHILPVYDFDGANEPPYIVMRYLEGGTLKEVLKRGSLPFGEIAYLIQQISSAMDYAHRQGIIHRDLKPSNIMVDRDGNAFVTDFGIARIAAANRAADHDRGITQTGSVIGTPDYMAPEQGMGRSDIDSRADIYSLGVMLFQMITGKLPYTAELPMAVVVKHINEPVPTLTEVQPALPEDIGYSLDRVIRKVMAKDPADRYKTASEFSQAAVEALGALVATAPISIREAASEAARIISTRREEKRDEIKATMATFAAERGKVGTGTDSQKYKTPTEQHKIVTAVYINAAEYAELVEEVCDTESAHEAMKQWWEAVNKIVAEYGGKVLSHTEGIMLALWGIESAREDDPERALRAALDMQSTLRTVGADYLDDSGGDPLPLRIGVNTGSVLLTPLDKTGSYTATGATVNLTIRLSENAEGMILVAHDTFRYVFGIFDFEEHDPLKLRGRKERLPVYHAIRARQRVFRMNTRGVEGIQTEMIGREAELKQLQNAFFAAVEDQETQVVTVTGDAGIGKSRLLYDFNAWCDLRPEVYRFFQSRPTPEMSNRPYALLRNMLTYRFEIMDSDPPAAVREKMEKGVADLIENNGAASRLSGAVDVELTKEHLETAHLIGHLVGFDFSDSPFIKGLLGDPQQLTRRARQAFLNLMSALGHKTFVLMLLEDIHWADDASLDLLTDLVNENHDMALLMVCIARPQLYERRPLWGSERDVHRKIDLQSLTKRDSRALVKEILQKMDEVPKALSDLIVERAEGNPYYIEELVKMLIEDHIIQKGDDTWTVEESRLANLPVPPTLIGLLQARLDSLLYPERVALQRASVIGRIFWDSAVAALEPGDEAGLENLTKVLTKLTEREFIHTREVTAFEGAKEYVFAQSMLRDVVYDSMISRQQKQYHQLVAEWLIANSRERVNEYLNLIAEHYDKAGELEKASEFLGKAGVRAQSVSAYNEALCFYDQALALLPDYSYNRRTTLQLRIAEVHRLLGNFNASREYLNAMITLARQRGDDQALAGGLYQLSQVAVNQADWDSAVQYLSESLPLARNCNDRHTLAHVLYGLGDVKWRLGKTAEVSSYLEESLALAHNIDDPSLVLLVLNRKGTVTMYSDPDGAATIYGDVLKLAREIGSRERAAIALSNMGEIYRAQAKYKEAIVVHSEALTIGKEIEHPGLTVNTAIALGLDEIFVNDLSAAQQHLREALQVSHKIGATSQVLNTIVGFAGVEVARRNYDRALALMGLAFNHPASETNVREDAAPFIDQIKAALPQEAIEAGLERGKTLDYAAIVNELLK